MKQLAILMTLFTLLFVWQTPVHAETDYSPGIDGGTFSVYVDTQPDPPHGGGETAFTVKLYENGRPAVNHNFEFQITSGSGSTRSVDTNLDLKTDSQGQSHFTYTFKSLLVPQAYDFYVSPEGNIESIGVLKGSVMHTTVWPTSLIITALGVGVIAIFLGRKTFVVIRRRTARVS